eukprot:TRINITY_DN3792_c1_g3_i1.p1 TRINITY_DN3792_c1_g3~~TRINITY_DN3792_c1_g3_i1.p1  ORF type:complete len:172 (+),score=29.75 TRINITY_DN3792_c1_g3_i1:26-541(+)
MAQDEDELPSDWGEESPSEAIKNHEGLTVAVHGVDWMPHCKYYLLSALAALNDIRRGKYKDDVQIILVNQEGAWKWAKHENVMIGTPVTYFYYAGHPLRVSANCERDDLYIGELSSSLLVSICIKYLASLTEAQISDDEDFPPVDIPQLVFNLVDDEDDLTEKKASVTFNS